MKRIVDCEVYLKDLKYGFGNPRKISKSKLKELKQSVEMFGIWRSIGIDENNNIIFGSQLSIVAKELKIELPIKAKRLIGYTEAELKAINIKDNEHAGEWDFSALAKWEEDLKQWDFIDVNKQKKKSFTKELEEDISIQEKSFWQLKRNVKFKANNYWGVPELLENRLLSIEKNKSIEVLLTDSLIKNDKDYYILLFDENLKKIEGKIPPEKVIICFYLYDLYFEKFWAYPEIYTQKLLDLGIKKAIGFNFSLYSTESRALQLYNIFRSAWLNRYLQEAGFEIIPDINFCDEESLNFSLLSLKKDLNCVSIQIQNLRDEKEYDNFIVIFKKVNERIKIEKLLIYGSEKKWNLIKEFMPNNIEYLFILERQEAKRIRLINKEA